MTRVEYLAIGVVIGALVALVPWIVTLATVHC